MLLIVRSCTISLVTIAVALAGLATVAQADDAGVKAAIKAQDHQLTLSPQLKQLLHTKKSITAAQAPAAIKACQGLERRLNHAAGVVAKTSGSTAAGKAGKRDWVKGVRDLAHGFSQLTTALKDIEHGNKSAAQTRAAAALKTIANANALGVKADHELKLPAGS